MRLSESKYPPGSDKRWTSRANAESIGVSAGASDDANAALVDARVAGSIASDPVSIAAGMAAISHRIDRNLELIDNLRLRRNYRTCLHLCQSSGPSRRTPGPRALRLAQPLGETLCIMGRMYLCVVVEVDVGIASFSAAPAANARRPVVELRIAIPTYVEHGGAVQSNVDEVRRHFLGVRELSGCVREHERAPMCAEQVVELRAEVGRMSYLERVSIANPSSIDRVDEGTAPQPMVMMARHAFGGEGIPRQHAHEVIETFRLEAVRRRKLPEKRSRLRAEGEDAAGEEVSERTLAIAQLEIVCDEPAALDGKDKFAVRYLRRPAREHTGRFQTVERPVQLNGVEAAAGIGEPARPRELLGIEGAAPTRIVVAADADVGLPQVWSLLRGRSRRRRMRRHEPELSEKRGRSGVVGKRVQRAEDVFLAHGEAGADRVGIDADTLEFFQQLREPLPFRHYALPRDRWLPPSTEASQAG